MFKVIIAGGRRFNDYDLLKKSCDHMLQKYDPNEIIIVSGGAKGADTLGEKYAQESGMKIERYPVNWHSSGVFDRTAGLKRNEVMGRTADAAVIFWDNESHGTKHMISYMRKLKKPCEVFYY